MHFTCWERAVNYNEEMKNVKLIIALVYIEELGKKQEIFIVSADNEN